MAKKVGKKTKKADIIADPADKMQSFVYYYLFGGEINGKTFRLGNATMSYAKAYGLDPEDKKQYNTCSVMGLYNLRNAKIKEMMRQVLDDNGLNDEVVDARLLDIIKNAQAKDSVSAIKEYNSLKKRIDNNININNIVITQEVEEKVEDALSSFLKAKNG